MSSTTARRRARQKAAPQADITPETTPEPQLSCEVCHIPGDDKTLENRFRFAPYWLCKDVPECNKRLGIVRDEVPADDEPQAEAAAEETAEVSK